MLKSFAKLNESRVRNYTSRWIGTAWWPYGYVSVDFCIDSVSIVTVLSQPWIVLFYNDCFNILKEIGKSHIFVLDYIIMATLRGYCWTFIILICYLFVLEFILSVKLNVCLVLKIEHISYPVIVIK